MLVQGLLKVVVAVSLVLILRLLCSKGFFGSLSHGNCEWCDCPVTINQMREIEQDPEEDIILCPKCRESALTD